MGFAAGALSQTAVTQSTATLAATAASGGTTPYTYQWYRSTTTGFTPGTGNIISGATALTLSDTGLVPNTQYYYKVKATDSAGTPAVVTYTQLAVQTSLPSQNQNAFAQSSQLGMVDMRYSLNTVSVQIDSSQATALYAGSAVVMVDSVDGVPKVVGATASTDNVLGFINYDIKTVAYTAGMAAEISMAGNFIYLYSTTAIARGAQVTLDITSPGGVATITAPNRIVGWAYDKATAAGQLIRIVLTTPSFAVAS
jgi:beta-galactosidase